GQLLPIEFAEHRQVADNVADDRQLGLGHVAVGRRDHHHRADQRAVRVEHQGSFRFYAAQTKTPRGLSSRLSRGCQAGSSRKALVISIASTNGTRKIGTPAGNAASKRDGKARSRIAKTPRSSARRTSLP